MRNSAFRAVARRSSGGRKMQLVTANTTDV
jgi:hypothetical protein